MAKTRKIVPEPTTGPIRSYYARYRGLKGTLIGGVTASQTSRFDSRSEAQLRLDQTIEINGGPEYCEGAVVESRKLPEIFLHCGNYSTTVGSRCNGCGKTLTEDDRAQSKART